jgi:UTP--glucose-1-phosphate uridylyltransferase
MQVRPDEISAYGCVDGEPASDDLVAVRGIVEKPPADAAPSNLAVIGRYVFTPAIFDALDRIEPGAGGELQLTDAIGLLLEEQTVYGRVFSEGRFDAGQKVDWLRANVELALRHPDLGDDVARMIVDVVRRHDLLG